MQFAVDYDGHTEVHVVGWLVLSTASAFLVSGISEKRFTDLLFTIAFTALSALVSLVVLKFLQSFPVGLIELMSSVNNGSVETDQGVCHLHINVYWLLGVWVLPRVSPTLTLLIGFSECGSN